MGETPDRYVVSALARGLAALQAFGPGRDRMTLGELAAATGVTKSAVFRTAHTLTQLGFLLHDPRSRTYALGPAVLRLATGALAAREVLQAALPVLDRLRDETGWSAHLGVLDGREVVYLLRAPAAPREGIVHVGSRLPAHATAMGRVLLAGLPDQELAKRYRDATLPRIGPRTPTTLAMLLAQARRDRGARQVGHLGDFEAGIASIAAPIREGGAVVAAINVTVPLAEAREVARATATRALLEAADAISAALAGP
ncbi:IclR family transcriptional regulator [Roseomonas sp. CCTCC AB2023176]|uniref:IclR family transcriptional regulator n=1 Tax=Roseomonas sp. CCTCC AB2023176 TaxID=3342640 RepID=UPI0035E33050